MTAHMCSSCCCLTRDQVVAQYYWTTPCEYLFGDERCKSLDQLGLWLVCGKLCVIFSVKKSVRGSKHLFLVFFFSAGHTYYARYLPHISTLIKKFPAVQDNVRHVFYICPCIDFVSHASFVVSRFRILLYVITNRSFHPRRTVAGRGALTFLPLSWPSTVVVPLTSCRKDSYVCCRSAVLLRPSCGERRTDTIMLSAVVLPYGSGRHAAPRT